MKLLQTYSDREEAEAMLAKLAEPRRLASERDGTETIYNLFGEPSWTNFYSLGLFDLEELRSILEARKDQRLFDAIRHKSIIKTLSYVANQYSLRVPRHWL